MSINSAFAQRLNIKVGQLNLLISLIKRSVVAQELEHNEQNALSSDPEIKAVEDYAKSLGYGCIWPGLYPVLTKDGQEFHLPG